MSRRRRTRDRRARVSLSRSRIARFRLIDRNLAPEDPELTPMMKLRRNVVLAQFARLVDDATPQPTGAMT